MDINTGEDLKPHIEVNNLAIGKEELMPPIVSEVEKRSTSRDLREPKVTIPAHKETIAIEQEDPLDEYADVEEESSENDLEYEYADFSEEITSPRKDCFSLSLVYCHTSFQYYKG